MSQRTSTCPHCGIEPLVVREERHVPLGQRSLLIEDEWSRCPQCGENFYSQDQSERRHRLALERARLEDGLLPPREIRQVREALGFTQREFEEILGVGEKTVVRWESGRVCQNKATDRLIRLVAANRKNLQTLAAINGFALAETGDTEPPYRLGIPVSTIYTFDVRPRLAIGGMAEVPATSHTEEMAAVRGALDELKSAPLPPDAYLKSPVRGGA